MRIKYSQEYLDNWYHDEIINTIKREFPLQYGIDIDGTEIFANLNYIIEAIGKSFINRDVYIIGDYDDISSVTDFVQKFGRVIGVKILTDIYPFLKHENPVLFTNLMNEFKKTGTVTKTGTDNLSKTGTETNEGSNDNFSMFENTPINNTLNSIENPSSKSANKNNSNNTMTRGLNDDRTIDMTDTYDLTDTDENISDKIKAIEFITKKENYLFTIVYKYMSKIIEEYTFIF